MTRRILTNLWLCLVCASLVWLLVLLPRPVRCGAITKSDKGTVVRLPDDAYTVAQPFYYVVQQNDDLHWLAAMFYGDARQWKVIYRANRDQLRDPNHLKIGQKLIIPASL